MAIYVAIDVFPLCLIQLSPATSNAHNVPTKRGQTSILTLSQVLQLNEQQPEKILKELLGNLKNFQKVLNSHKKWNHTEMRGIITVLLELTKTSGSSVNRLFAEILSHRCNEFTVKLTKYIREIENLCDMEDICRLFLSLLKLLPSEASFVLPVDDIKYVVEEKFTLTSDHVVFQLTNELVSLAYESRATETDQKKYKPTARIQTRYDYQEEQILPKVIELIHPHLPQLRANVVEGSYSCWEQYYDIQFRLLREDFVAPLRRGVCGHREGLKGKDIPDVKVYHQVRFLSCQVEHNGVFMQLQFDVTHLKNVRWEHGKRLIYGSLLCLSHDNFESMVFATVAAGKVEDLSKGKVIVKIESEQSVLRLIKRKHVVYTMIESQAHYETYYHVLHSLQNAETSTMPFKQYLIDSHCTIIEPPVHFGMHSISIIKYMPPVYDLQNALGAAAVFNISNDEKWNNLGTSASLDQSQLEALKLALTKEISVIQGPPGTGKTYIGKKIVEALLVNKRLWDPTNSSPVLVVCYTNHALDQFLEGIIEMLDCDPSDPANAAYKIIRIGSRCTNEVVNKFNIRCFRKQFNNHNGYYMARRDLTKNAKKLSELFSVMEGRKLPMLTKLKPVINSLHYDQLTQGLLKRSKPNYGLYSDASEDEEDQYEAVGTSLNFALMRWLKCGGQSKDTGRMAEDNSNKRKGKCRAGRQRGAAGDSHTDLIDTFQEAQEEFHKRFLDEDEASHFRFDSTQATFSIRTSYKEHQVNKIKDIYKLSLHDREQLYSYWVLQYSAKIQDQLQADIVKHMEGSKVCEDMCKDADQDLFERAHLIGMTTTGAAKYQHIIQRVKPKIVVVEEAAEVMECHIVSCLTAATQQLILIGDHKQLRPNPNEYYLARDYNLDISLFERLIRAGIPHAMLQIQHRMRPEIAGLVCPFIYPTLLNHDSVLSYEDVHGVITNMYFFDHQYPEAEISDLKSHSNVEEAKLVVGLCDYLLKQGYSPSQITVLTTYTGQLLKLRPLMPKEKFEGVRVTVVDNFQGEENDIIILSLVRSNKNDSVGFLRTDNRVCVALSRAKKGFFCFGNFSLLRRSSELWDNIVAYMEKLGKIGSGLELYCCTHPDKKAVISKCGDFSNVPDGGCSKKCVARLDCGHTCALHCHPKDPDHREYLCKKPCAKKCDMGHPCVELCHKPCPKCMVPVPRVIPKCKHTQPVPCHMNPSLYSCQAPCENKCPKGHGCHKLCSQPCGPCETVVTKQLSCGHTVELLCYEKLPNCEQLVSKVLPQCGHEQLIPCHMDPNDRVCEEACERKLHCGHRCTNKCGSQCVTYCYIEVKKIHPVCGHKISVLCGSDVLKAKCSTKVKKTLSCGHEITTKCSDTESDVVCTKKVTLIRDCGHKYEGTCNEVDTRCKELVNKTFPGCGHVVKLACGTDLPSHCNEECMTTLLCGHKCIGTCSECHQGRMHKSCSEMMSNPLPCGHKVSISCAGIRVPICKDPCKIKCSHQPCTNSCSENCSPCFKPCEWKCRHYICTKKCYESCDRPPCNHRCPKRLRCGHSCIGVCGEKCPNVCRVCPSDRKRFSDLCISKYKDGNKYIQLECGHMFEVENFTKYIVKTYEQSDVVKLIRCPAKNCEEILQHSFRFNHVIKEVRKYIMQTQNPQHAKEAETSYQAFQQTLVKLIAKFTLQLKSISSKESYKITESFEELRKFVEAADKPSVQKIQDILCEHRRLGLLFLVTLLQKAVKEKGLHRDLTEYKILFDSYGIYKQQTLVEKEATEYFDILQKEAISILGYCPVESTDIIVEKPKISKGVWMRCSKGHYYCNPRIPKGFCCDLKHDSCPDCA